MKRIATAVGTIGLLAATVLPAFAGNDCVNDTTGPYSTNYCDIQNKSSVEVENVNQATIKNYVTGDANTGGNTASGNTLGGTIVTGDAKAESSVANLANVNTNTITTGSIGGSNTGANDTTGPFSDNRIDMTNSQKVDVSNVNDLTVKNHVDVTSDTGYNRADENTGPAVVRTGSAWAGLDVVTHGNDNLTTVTGAGTGAGFGGNTADNHITGPFSTNYVDITNRSKVEVENVNDAFIKNWVDVAAYTGDNSTSRNTLGGEIITGGADAGVEVNNEANINSTRVWSAFGGFANAGENAITGPGSDNRNDIVNRHYADVDNINDVFVKNHVDVASDTGYNKANENTAGGYVRSGWADMWQEVLSHVNDSLNDIKI